MDTFTTSAVAKMFAITDQTVKNWSGEFKAYLSPIANPPSGQKRLFSLDDLKVFALVYDYSKRGLRHHDAHQSLRSGQRGDIPSTVQDITPFVPPQLVAVLRDEVETLRVQIKDYETQRDKAQGQVELMERILKEKEEKIERLYQENAELKAELKQRLKP